MNEESTIRLMTAEDLDAVVALERRCYGSPWSAELFRRELDNPLSTVELLWIGDTLAGYLCRWQVADEMHVLNVATDPEFRRRGVARTLLESSFGRGSEEGVRRVFLEVRVGNAGAIALYRSLGFRISGRRANYYPDGEDALLMERETGRGGRPETAKENGTE